MNKQSREINNGGEDASTKQLNLFVQNMLKTIQDRFDEMSNNIIGRVDQMGKRVDEIEQSISEIMKDLGDEDQMNKKQQK